MRTKTLFLCFWLAMPVMAIDGVPGFPEKAYAVEDLTVPGSKTMQAALKLKSEYPQSAVVAHYYTGVSEDWQVCRSKRNRGWETYEDKTGKSPRQVHQLIRYWVNPDQRKMLTVIVRHYSKTKTTDCKPDNDEQHAVVVVSHSPELEKEIYLLKLACGANTGLSTINTAPPASCN